MAYTELIIRVLLEGATLAAVLIVIAFLLSRFTRDIVGRSQLVIFLFLAPLVGLRAPLYRSGAAIYSLDLRDRVCQFRLVGCHLYHHRLRTG
jgi:hypothetical protein